MARALLARSWQCGCRKGSCVLFDAGRIPQSYLAFSMQSGMQVSHLPAGQVDDATRYEGFMRVRAFDDVGMLSAE